ncbi:MAG TPA: hypothetical protein VFP57_05270 [Sphingomicrobium sp.]|nr:hypothetical protein [Sphingomicrobium sp.]
MSHARTTVDVEVTPQLKQGAQTYCEIDPAPGSNHYVKGGMIKLPKNGAEFEINFSLIGAAAMGEEDDACWKPEDDQGDAASSRAVSSAFWSNRGSCPTSAMQDSQVTNVKVAGNVLTVTIVPDGSKNAIHYSLNFADGTSFDPIIIHM